MNLKKAVSGLVMIFALALSTPVLAQTNAPTNADVLEMSARIQNVQGSNTYVLVTITNHGTQILDQLNFKCVFTHEGEPVGVAQGYIQRLAPEQSDTVQVYSNTTIQSDDYACRATQAMVYF